jgi:hypothetical protein
MEEKDIRKLLNEILEWANSNETKIQNVNDLAHYLFKIAEAKKTREETNDIDKKWDEWKKEKLDIIVNGLK